MSTRRRATIANSNMAPPPPATPRAQTGRRTPRASLNLVASAQQQQRARATNLPTPHPPARQPATSRRAKPWRQSIVDGSTNYNTLSERAQLVKGPATVALLGMLALGTQDDDSQGDDGDSGDMRLNDTRKTEYAAFEAVKLAYLSSAKFLNAESFPVSTYPGALDDPQSSLNLLIKLANLTTFLHLILSSAPGLDGGRSREDGNRLRDAAAAFMRYVVPVDSQMHDGTLKMLVGLKCQAYLAAAASARTKPDVADFFSTPLSDYLPDTDSGDVLANRASSIRFNKYQNDVVDLIEKTGGDTVALQTKWQWNKMILEVKNYCKGVAELKRGPEEDSLSSSGAVSEEQLAPMVVRPVKKDVKGKGKAVVQDEEEQESVEQQSEDQMSEEDEEEEEVVATARRQSGRPRFAPEEEEEAEAMVEGEFELLDGDYRSGDDEEQFADGEEEHVDASVSQSTSRNSLRSASEVAHQLGLESPRQLLESSPIKSEEDLDESLSTQAIRRAREAVALRDEGDDDDSSSQASEEDEQDQETFEQTPGKPSRVAELRDLLNSDSEDEEDQEIGIDRNSSGELDLDTQTRQRASEAADLRDLSDSESDEHPQMTQGTANRAAAARALRDEDDSDEEDEEERPAIGPPRTSTAKPSTSRIAIGSSNRLTRVPVAPGKSFSMLDRQHDAERIDFDSPAPPSPKASRAPKSATKSTFIGVVIPSRRSVSVNPSVRSSSMAPSRRSPSVPIAAVEQSRASGRKAKSKRVEPVEPVVEHMSDVEEEEERERSQVSIDPALFEEERRRMLEDDPFESHQHGGEGFLKDEAEFAGFEREEDVAFKDQGTDDARQQPMSDKRKGKQRQRSISVDSTGHSRSVRASTEGRPAAAPASAQRDAQLKKKKKKRLIVADYEADIFLTDNESDDLERVRKNRSAKRRNPDSDEDAIFQPRVAPPKASAKRRRQTRTRSRSRSILHLTDSTDDDDDETRERRKRKKKEHARRRARDSDSDDSDEVKVVTAGKHNLYFQRRNGRGGRIAWTTKEEQMLKKVMNEMPCAWSKIIAMHGPDGTHSRVFKHRTPVSLKDKAVNLKLDLLRRGLQVPWFLENVTVSKSKYKAPPTPADSSTD